MPPLPGVGSTGSVAGPLGVGGVTGSGPGTTSLGPLGPLGPGPVPPRPVGDPGPLPPEPGSELGPGVVEPVGGAAESPAVGTAALSAVFGEDSELEQPDTQVEPTSHAAKRPLDAATRAAEANRAPRHHVGKQCMPHSMPNSGEP